METSLLTTPTLFNIELHDDLKACINFINKQFDNPNLYTVGMSMGSYVVLQNSGK